MGLLPFTAKASGRSALGTQGETLALDFLKKKGLRILARNYRFGKKEIDIIAQERGTVCFIEVKTRSSQEFGLPQEALTYRKIQHLTQLALGYIKRYKLSKCDFRFDVVSVLWENNKKEPVIDYIKDAFPVDERWSV
jgi:putative endonuclease